MANPENADSGVPKQGTTSGVEMTRDPVSETPRAPDGAAHTSESFGTRAGSLPGDMIGVLRDNAGRFRWLGIALIITGVLAILFPVVASIATKVMIGWFLMITGALVLWHAFQSREWSGALWSGAIGVLHIVAGAYLAFLPLTGLIGLTVLMAVVFALQGMAEIALSWQHRPGHGNEGPGWVWMGFSGAVSLGLAILLMLGLPGTALWSLGLILGINFLSSGLSFVMLASRVGDKA